MIELTEEMRERIGSALTDGFPVVVATTSLDGQPTMSFRGTMQVHSADQLGFWVRNREGGLLANIAENPKLEVLYRNGPERIMWRFQGRARMMDDDATRTTIYDNSPEVEQGRDPDRKGTVVLIEVDRVFALGQLAMER